MLQSNAKPMVGAWELAIALVTLKALVAAVEEGSLRAAARRRGVSQPALSKMIRELELELGAPLLARTSKGVLPTAQGKVLYERSLKVCRELGYAVDEISPLGGKSLKHTICPRHRWARS